MRTKTSKTKHDRLVAALEARGYRVTPNPRGPTKYTELTLDQSRTDARPLLKAGNERSRILVGRAGALRHTRKAIADSMPFSDVIVARLLEEGGT